MNYKIFCSATLLISMFQFTDAMAEEHTADDGVKPYPTTIIADYVLGCMAANGNTRESLHQCSCSIDYISARVPFEDYEKIQTIMQIQMDRGQRGIFYRDSQWAKSRVEALQKVQAASTLRCF